MSIPSSRYSKEYFLLRPHPKNVHLKALSFLKSTSGAFLDVGCGKGELVICLAGKGKRSFGVDYSKDAIAIANDRLKKQKKNVQSLANFRLASSTKLPFGNNTFGCLFLLDVVEHLTDNQVRQTLLESRRVLKKKGVLIIHTNNKHFEEKSKLLIAAFYHGLKVFLSPVKIIQEMPSDPFEKLHINYFTGSRLTGMLKDRGFETYLEYVRPNKKSDLAQFVPYQKTLKRFIFYEMVWLVLNSPLVRFISPTFWIVAKKI